MCKIFSILAISVFIALNFAKTEAQPQPTPTPRPSPIAKESCRTLVLTLVDPQEKAVNDAKAIFLCNGSDLGVPTNLSIHMMLATEKGFCYSDYSCGNLNAWYGHFSGATGIGFGETLQQFFEAGHYRWFYPQAQAEVQVKFTFEWLNVQRYCTQQSAAVCFPYY